MLKRDRKAEAEPRRPSFWQASLALSTVSLIGFVTKPVHAQITPDHSLGDESSLVSPNVTVKDAVSDLISGGAVRGNNLFHSFLEFNVRDGNRVYFANPDGVANILTRVTGNNLSQIFGTLGVDGAANLFILNPNGIIFGKNASLDVAGSFLATTADRFIFQNGFEYSATNPNFPPLLTINMPVGLQFGEKAEAIEVRGTGNNLSFDPETYEPTWDLRAKGLEVDSGNTLALIGGEINLEGGNLTASPGRIELASLAENNNVSLISTDNSFSLATQENTNFKDINLTQSASIDTSGNANGDLQLQGKNISLLDGSAIITRILGDENGREVNINASDSVNITGTNAAFFSSGIYDEVAIDATGDAENFTIDAAQLQIKDGALISTKTYGAGDGADISVSANKIEVLGGSSYDASGLRTDTYATGKGGNLIIDADTLQIKDGAQIGAGTFGSGDSGNLFIRATNVEVIGFKLVDGFPFPSGIFTPVSTPETTGNGGNLTIDAEQLIVRDGALISSYAGGDGNAGNIEINVQKLKIGSGLAQITTETYGKGNAGDLKVSASESIEISGTGLIPSYEYENEFSLFSSGLFANVEPRAKGNGGNLTLATPNLKIFDGGKITTSTSGSGYGGDLFIRANNLEVRDTVVDHLDTRSGISSSVEKQGSNHGGNIDIMASNLRLIDGGFIAANALGQGNAGNIKINAQNIDVFGVSSEETILGFPQPRLASTISAFSGGEFDAGSINIKTDNLNISDRGLISVSNLESGNSGNLNITAKELNLDNFATLEAKVGAGSQGNINLTTDNILLRNSSEINAQASATATGGNITIDNQDNIVLLENSQIIADAIKGNGGKINITAQGLFVSSDSKITAKSQFALDGTVDIDEINGDRHLESNRLPENTVDPSSLITSACPTSNENTFAVTGNGGVPNSPYSTQSLNATWYDLRPVKQEPTKLVSLAIPLTEANTTIINDQGKLELIALTPLSTYRWVKSSCGNQN